jgi:hypothetical protein
MTAKSYVVSDEEEKTAKEGGVALLALSGAGAVVQ